MDVRSFHAERLVPSRWTPFAASARVMPLGQAVPPPAPAPAPAPTPAQPPPPPPAFIDSAIFAFCFDGAIAVAGAIAGNVWWRNAKEKTSPSEKASNKRAAYVFYGIAGVAAVKGVLDAGRIMR